NLASTGRHRRTWRLRTGDQRAGPLLDWPRCRLDRRTTSTFEISHTALSIRRTSVFPDRGKDESQTIIRELLLHCSKETFDPLVIQYHVGHPAWNIPQKTFVPHSFSKFLITTQGFGGQMRRWMIWTERPHSFHLSNEIFFVFCCILS